MSLVQVMVLVVPAVQVSPPLGEVTVSVDPTAGLKFDRKVIKVMAVINIVILFTFFMVLVIKRLKFI